MLPTIAAPERVPGGASSAGGEPWTRVAALGLLIAVSALAVDLSLPAIPALAAHYAIPSQQGQLVVTAYLAGFACGQLPAGVLSDRWGRRPVLFCGLTAFIVAGAVAALAPSAAVLFAARAVQGAAGAVGPVLSRAIARDLGDERDGGAPLIATLVSILGLTPLLAPLLGGLITQLAGWHWTLGVVPVYGALTLIAMGLAVPETLPPTRRQTHPTGSHVAASLRALGQSPSAALGVALVCLPFGGYLAMVTGASTLLIEGFGLRPAMFGGVFATGALAYTAGATATRTMLTRGRSTHAVLAVGVSTFVAACALMVLILLLPQRAPLPLLWSMVTIFVFGVGITAPAATSLALAPMPGAAGFTAALLGTGSILAGTLGSLASAHFHRTDGTSMVSVMLVSGLATLLAYAIGHPSVMPPQHAGRRHKQ